MGYQVVYLFEHDDFPDLVDQTALELKIPFAFIEKDYWVTYVLYRLKKAGVDDMIFKGGTSLTKGWNLLERFSEDIDLLFFPFDKNKSQKEKRLKEIKAIVSGFKGLTFDKDISENRGAYRKDCYKYEKKADESPVLLPYIKLEMGYRGGDSPSKDLEIQSYMGKLIESRGGIAEVEDLGKFRVKTLDLTRTFSEKTFAVYSAHANDEIEKHFRHYYDVYKLLQHKDVLSFLGSDQHKELKKHIAKLSEDLKFSKTQFPKDLDFSGADAFIGSEKVIETLDRALKNSADLFFATPPTAKEILTIIEKHRSKF